MKAAPFLILAAGLVFLQAADCFAERAIVEHRAKQEAEFYREAKETVTGLVCSTDYDYGWVRQGGRDGAWKLVSTEVGYSAIRNVYPYLLFEGWDRFREKDYTLNSGAYFKLSDRASLHAEAGFGMDIDFIYRMLFRLEYENKLAGPWNWSCGYRFLSYPDNDVHIIYPGLTYYFGDSYLQFVFNDAFTESRGSAQSGSTRLHLTLTKKLAFYSGWAYGERLFDIFLLPASRQKGYIVFSGCEYQLTKQLRGRLGFSYSREDPSFIKRSVEAGLSLRF